MSYICLVSPLLLLNIDCVCYNYDNHCKPFTYKSVDGIYPDIVRFVKTLSEPLTNLEKAFAAWQEGARKDIERAFGVLQRKFHFLVNSIELWCNIRKGTL